MLSFVYVDFPYDIIYYFKPLVKKNVLTISNFDIILKMKYRMSILRGGAMSKKALDTLTETMFYVLMAFSRQDMCGTEIAGYVKDITGGRVSMGPGTLYTILSNFQKEGLIDRVSSAGRKITYSITETGRGIYEAEINRLKQCIADACGEE